MAAAPVIPGPRPFLVEITLQTLAECFEAGYITAEEQGREWILELHDMAVLRQGSAEC